jgi:hypothetical protein
LAPYEGELPRIPIFRGYHICESEFVQQFKDKFLEEVSQKDLEKEELGMLFSNPVIGRCNIVT